MFFQRKFIIAFVFVLVVLLLLVVAGRNNTILAVEGKFFSFFGSIGSSAVRLGGRMSDVRQGIFHYREVMDENAALQERYLGAMDQLSRLLELEKENSVLREALLIRQEMRSVVVPAHVTGFARDINEEMIFIDKGMNDGIRQGDVVVWRQRVLVGRTIEAYAGSAKVLLATSLSQKFDVFFASTTLRAVASGADSREFTLGFVPGNAFVSQADIVLTSRNNVSFPGGLIVGAVSRVAETESRVFRDVWVRSPFDPEREETVYVLIPPR